LHLAARIGILSNIPEDPPLDPRFLGPDGTTSAPRRIYVNNVGIRGGAFDLTLDLGYGVPPSSPDQPPEPPEWLTRVSMSWEHAVALRDLLDGAIKQYQDLAGQLPDLEKLRTGGQQ
jgi:hypothetical protein